MPEFTTVVEKNVLRSSKIVVPLSNVTASYALPPGAPTINVVASDEIDNAAPKLAFTDGLGLTMVCV